MKKFSLFLAMALCLAFSAAAQTVTLSNTAGGLAAQLANVNTNTTTLVVNGVMDQRDFNAITVLLNTGLSNVTKLDLSGITKIPAYTYGGTVYPENALPGNAFYYIGTVHNLRTLVLPENVINRISYNAFLGLSLSSLNIPASVKIIENAAFGGMTNLTKLDIPATVDSVGNNLFTGDIALQEVNFLGADTKIGSYVGTGFFNNDLALTKVTLPSNLKYIQSQMFSYCSGLTTLQLPAGLQIINDGAFKGCSSLVLKTEDFPSGLVSISGYQTFQNSGLVSINLKNIKIQSYSNDGTAGTPGVLNTTFGGCPNLTSVVFPDAGVTSMTYTFTGCTGLQSMVLPEGLTTLGVSVFYGCTNLKSVQFPSTLTAIGANDFNGCTGLATITIPASVQTIGANAFSGATGLKSIVSENAVSPAAGSGAFTSVDKTIPLYIPQAGFTDYAAAPGWTDFTNRKVIGSDAKTQTVAHLGDFTAHVGGQPVTLPSQSDQNLPLTYTIQDGKTGVATLSGNVLTIVGEGTATITATQAGDNLNWNAFTQTITLTVMDYSYLKAAAIAVEGDSMLVVGPGAGAYTKLYVNGTSTNGNLSATSGTVNLKATNDGGTKILKLTITHQAAAAAASAASNNAAGRAATERSLKDAVNNSFVNPGSH